MGGNKDNMRQAMKELLGLVGFGPEDEEGGESTAAEARAIRTATRTVERPVEQPRRERVVEEPAAEQRTSARPTEKVKAKEVVTSEPTQVEEPRKKTAPVERSSFFSFGEPKEKAPTFTRVERTRSEEMEEPFFAGDMTEERAPFIRPGATIIAAGATFFGDLRAEGDVEVLGKLKGNLEATGNVRVVGKVLGDVKGEAVVLAGCSVQGNITSTSFVSVDEGSMVVGDVLATDFESSGRVKGNLQIARAATFATTALLAGNVIAGTIVMNQGARVQGAVRIAEDPETNSLFGDLEI